VHLAKLLSELKRLQDACVAATFSLATAEKNVALLCETHESTVHSITERVGYLKRVLSNYNPGVFLVVDVAVE
jgi:hypothetical protein